MVSLTWNATTFVSNMRIILPLPKLLAPTAPYLRPLSFAIGSPSNNSSTCSVEIRSKETRLFCLGLSSKLSFGRVWRTSGYLLSLFGIELIEISSIKIRQFRIGLSILSISNLFSLNSMLTGLQKSPPLFVYSEMGSSLQLKHR